MEKFRMFIALVFVLFSSTIGYDFLKSESIPVTDVSFKFDMGAIVQQSTAEQCADPTYNPTQTFDVYKNTTSEPMYIHTVYMWAGLFRGSYADMAFELYIISDNHSPMIIAPKFQDRYDDPSSDQGVFFSLPAPFILKPQDKIILNGLNCYVAGNPSPMHPVVILYFSNN